MMTVNVNPVKSICIYVYAPSDHVIKDVRDVFLETGLYCIKNHPPVSLFYTRVS